MLLRYASIFIKKKKKKNQRTNKETLQAKKKKKKTLSAIQLKLACFHEKSLIAKFCFCAILRVMETQLLEGWSTDYSITVVEKLQHISDKKISPEDFCP